MKLAITNEMEIETLLNLCNEVNNFYKELRHSYYADIDISEDEEYYKILYPIWKQSEDIEEFMTEVFKQFNLVHFSRILWNCSTLLSNCADLSSNILDFSPKINNGFEAIELLNEIDEYLSPNPKNAIYCTSILHTKIKNLLAKDAKKPIPTEKQPMPINANKCLEANANQCP